MNTFNIHSPAEVIFGLGTAKNAGVLTKKLGGTKTLIVTDAGILASGILDIVTESLDKADIQYDTFSEVVQDPTLENVSDGADLCQKNGFDSVVAVGGGSPIDAAKAICAMATNDRSAADYEGMDQFPNPALPLIAIPTTAGTGSEVGAWAVLTDKQSGRKFGMAGNSMIPRIAICDPELTVTMPPGITAATGLDALTHAIEGYSNTVYQPFADIVAKEAIRLIGKSLLPAIANGGNLSARSDMLYASMLAGVSNKHTALGAVHGMSLPIGALFGVPHGLANGILLPYVVRFSLNGNLECYREVARLLGEKVDGLSLWKGAEKAALVLEHLLRESGLPTSLKEVDVKPDSFEEMADEAVKSRLIAINPRVPNKTEIIEMYELAYEGFE